MATLTPASEDDRSDAAAFAGRVARWSPAEPVRLVADGRRGTDLVTLWASTPFDVLATRTVRAHLRPSTVTVRASDLLGGLAVSTAPEVDLGPDLGEIWRSRIPPPDGFDAIDDVPMSVITGLVRSATDAVAQRTDEPGQVSGRARGATVPDGVLDATAVTVSDDGREVAVPLRVLFALSGMGFAGDGADEVVHVRASRTWLRLDARYGAVVRRRLARLPLLV